MEGISGDTLCFRITAVHESNTYTSRSNIRCLPLSTVRSTTFNYLRNVTVNAAGTVDVQWYVDSAADINAYYVLRSLNGTSFSGIDTLPVTSPQFLNSYNDAQVTTSDNSYYYEVASYDECDFQLTTEPGRTILLEGDNNGVINTLDWNAFTLEHATVLDYTIYRVENGALVPITSVNPSTLTFEDDISTTLTEDGAFCYVVEANYRLEIPGIVTENLTSRSNEMCLYQKPVIFVPNAFVPSGKNNSFKPTLQNPNVAEYEFLIFDRWGKQLFSTDVLAAGWDGTNNGEAMPTGGYSYYIKVVSMGGEVEEKTGMVVLVR
jgi:gliding motility-associated-like protein